MKNYLIIPGILNLLASVSWIAMSKFENTFILTIGMFLIVSGVLCIMYSRLDINKLREKRHIVLIFGILSIPFNLVSAILLLVGTDKIKSEYAKFLREQDIQILDTEGTNVQNKTEVSKDVKKVSLLLKLGIVMVSISGIMIATTSWNIITDFVKMLIIALIGVAFLGLSFFSDKRIKVRGPAITYWVLSMIAFLLSIFMIGNYNILGDWFSISGDGSDIFICCLCLCTAVFSYITYKRFNSLSFLYGSCISVLVAISLVARFMTHEKEISLLILTIIIMIINLLPKSEGIEMRAVKLFGIISSFVITVLLIAVETGNELLMLITIALQYINLIYIAATDKKDEIRILAGTGMVALLIAVLNKINFDLDQICLLLINRSIILLAVVIMCALLSKNKSTSNTLLAIVFPLILSSMIFTIDIFVAIYIGCVSISMILFGYVMKDFKAIYVEGIVFLMANLVIQLWDLWGLLPIWVYLLIGGLTLIGVVTFREQKKD